jgi:hypothetical protein
LVGGPLTDSNTIIKANNTILTYSNTIIKANTTDKYLIEIIYQTVLGPTFPTDLSSGHRDANVDICPTVCYV